MGPNNLARWVSTVLHPFVVVPVTVGGLAGATPVLGVIVGFVLVVSGLVAWNVKRGRWTDLDVSNRRQRPALLRRVVLLLGLAVAVMAVAGESPRAWAGLVSSAVVILAALGLNRWLKPSLHCGFDAHAAGLLGIGPAGLALLVATAGVGWSRVALRRHTVAEVIVGTLMGWASGLAVEPLGRWLE